MKFVYFSLFIFCIPLFSSSQQTIGLFENSSVSLNGYTLFTSLGSPNTYLIDNCGEKVQEWNSSTGPGNAMYLLENGLLLRTKNVGNTVFTAGGRGGGIEMLDWDSNVIWEYTISSDTECQHHDISYLPNGNILAVVWEKIEAVEALQAGRDILGTNLWSEKIVEIQPDLINGGGSVVWEWRVFDHLIQDFDDTKDNFGVVAEHPELLNVNYHPNGGTLSDWLHINSVDYNEEHDQILLSVNFLNEIWVIDHSTSTEEAASHSGGNYNKGGDFLYRWGNPQSYQSGTIADQKLRRQHDAEWIEAGEDEGKILIFNNFQNTASSSVVVIETPVDIDGNYQMAALNYGPENYSWIYQDQNPDDFFSNFISGAQRLENGNTLICEGDDGRIFEVTENKETVWEYVNPTTPNSILNQGQQALGNATFRATRLALNHPGLDGQDLTPQGYLEEGSTFECSLFVSLAELQNLNLTTYPNPIIDYLTIEDLSEPVILRVFDSNGRIIEEALYNEERINLDFTSKTNGLYLISIEGLKSNKTFQTKILKAD